MNAPSPFPSLPGYQIASELGSGGFGTSYLGQRVADGLPCVIKVMAWDRLKDWKSLELFEREAKVLEALDHPRIPRFVASLQQEESLCLIQTFVLGLSLEQHLTQKGNFTSSQALDLALALTEILIYLQGFSPPLIHRDIKPSNIIIDSQNQPHLIDFGAVRDSLNPGPKTGGSTVVGTFGYMAPEQFQGRAFPATDIYSLGMTVIYALSRKSPEELESKGLQVDFRPWVKLPEAFAQVLEKMIAPDWQQRYPHAQALQADLLALKAGKPTSLQASGNIWTAPLPPKFRQALLLSVVGFLLFAVLWQMFSPVSQRNREEIRRKIERTYEEQYRERYGPLPQKSPG